MREMRILHPRVWGCKPLPYTARGSALLLPPMG